MEFLKDVSLKRYMQGYGELGVVVHVGVVYMLVVKSVFVVVHVGGTRCVTSTTDHCMNI